MADGSAFHTVQATGQATLADAMQPSRRLWAACRCGQEAAIDPMPWVAQGLGAATLGTLEERLRCACGARTVSLGVRDGLNGEAGPAGTIYVFR